MKQWMAENRERLMPAGIALLLVVSVTLGIRLLTHSQPAEEQVSNTLVSMMSSADTSAPLDSEEAAGEAEEELSVQVMYVDVKGAVANPGVYEMSEGDRVNDLIQAAGGFTEKAEQTTINLALRLSDQMMLYIPEAGEQTDTSSIPVQSPDPGQEKVNLNTADITELTTLNGIGEKKAEKIVQYREENGSFQSIEEIKNVSGIGEKTFESLKDSLTVTDW